MSVADSHAICNRIEDALSTSVPGANITIHVEPDDEIEQDSLTIS